MEDPVYIYFIIYWQYFIIDNVHNIQIIVRGKTQYILVEESLTEIIIYT